MSNSGYDDDLTLEAMRNMRGAPSYQPLSSVPSGGQAPPPAPGPNPLAGQAWGADVGGNLAIAYAQEDERLRSLQAAEGQRLADVSREQAALGMRGAVGGAAGGNVAALRGASMARGDVGTAADAQLAAEQAQNQVYFDQLRAELLARGATYDQIEAEMRTAQANIDEAEAAAKAQADADEKQADQDAVEAEAKKWAGIGSMGISQG